jgi:RNA recognition motif-containing protein
VFPEIAGSAKDLCFALIEDLHRNGPESVQKTLNSETRDAIREALKGNRDEAIKKRVSGEDTLTNRYLGKIKNMSSELEMPSDISITTLWVGNVGPDILERDLFDIFYAYGRLRSINLVRASSCAFVEYDSRYFFCKH